MARIHDIRKLRIEAYSVSPSTSRSTPEAPRHDDHVGRPNFFCAAQHPTISLNLDSASSRPSSRQGYPGTGSGPTTVGYSSAVTAITGHAQQVENRDQRCNAGDANQQLRGINLAVSISLGGSWRDTLAIENRSDVADDVSTISTSSSSPVSEDRGLDEGEMWYLRLATPLQAPILTGGHTRCSSPQVTPEFALFSP